MIEKFHMTGISQVKLSILCFILLFTSVFTAQAQDAEEGGTKIGVDKAVLEKSELGFRLSAEASKTLALVSEAFSGSIPCQSLLQVKGEKFIFTLNDGWFKKLPVSLISKSNEKCIVRATLMKAGDRIVTSGMSYLRLTEISLSESAEHSH